MSAIERELRRPRMLLILVAGLVVVLSGSYWTLAQEEPEPEPEEGGRPPSIVDNQFTTTSSGALQARAPGAFVQSAIGVQSGTVEVQGNGPTEETNFFKETFEMLFLQLIEEITAFIQSLSLLAGGSPLGGIDLGDLGGLTGA